MMSNVDVDLDQLLGLNRLTPPVVILINNFDHMTVDRACELLAKHKTPEKVALWILGQLEEHTAKHRGNKGKGDEDHA